VHSVEKKYQTYGENSASGGQTCQKRKGMKNRQGDRFEKMGRGRLKAVGRAAKAVKKGKTRFLCTHAGRTGERKQKKSVATIGFRGVGADTEDAEKKEKGA